jgi:hypothetical protein
MVLAAACASALRSQALKDEHNATAGAAANGALVCSLLQSREIAGAAHKSAAAFITGQIALAELPLGLTPSMAAILLGSIVYMFPELGAGDRVCVKVISDRHISANVKRLLKAAFDFAIIFTYHCGRPAMSAGPPPFDGVSARLPRAKFVLWFSAPQQDLSAPAVAGFLPRAYRDSLKLARATRVIATFCLAAPTSSEPLAGRAHRGLPALRAAKSFFQAILGGVEAPSHEGDGLATESGGLMSDLAVVFPMNSALDLGVAVSTAGFWGDNFELPVRRDTGRVAIPLQLELRSGRQ